MHFKPSTLLFCTALVSSAISSCYAAMETERTSLLQSSSSQEEAIPDDNSHSASLSQMRRKLDDTMDTTLPEGCSILCLEDPDKIYRWTEGELRYYPTGQIASSWNTAWREDIIEMYCTSVPVGIPMTMNYFDRHLMSRADTNELPAVTGFQSDRDLQASSLSIEKMYSIALVPDSTTAVFNSTSEDNEIIFKLKIAAGSENELDPINVFDFSTCKTPIGQQFVTAQKDSVVNNTVSDPSDAYYVHVPVLVDIKTGMFNQGPPAGYFTELKGDGKSAGADDIVEYVNLKFCVKSEMGSSTVVDLNAAQTMHTSVSYTKVKFDVTIDMKTSFVTNVEIKEENALTETENVQIGYELEAYECDVTNGERIKDPVPKIQNSMLTICISTVDQLSNIVIAEIRDMHLKSDSIASIAVDEYQSNALTRIYDLKTNTVMVTTQLVSAFYLDLDPNTIYNIAVGGTAVLEFTSATSAPTTLEATSRKLVGLGNTLQNNNVNSMGRNLDEEDNVVDIGGLGKFDMEVGISGTSEGAATSGASNARLSVASSVAMTTLALGGTLIGIIV